MTSLNTSTQFDPEMKVDYERLCRGDLSDPYPLYGWLRAHAPVFWSDLANSWILTRHRDVAQVLQHDQRLTAERLTPLIRQLPVDVQPRVEALRRHLATFVQYYDPPDHGRLRLTARDQFTPRTMAAWRERIEQVVTRLLSGLEASCDLVAEFAYPLPATVIAELLGVPPTDRERFKHWADLISQFLEGVGDDFDATAMAATSAVREMEPYLSDLLDERRKEPRNDLLTHLLHQLDAGRLSESEIYGWGMFLLLAGHETTTALIANGVHALLTHPEQFELLRKEPTLIETAIEEILRFDSPIQRISRVAIEDFELEGRQIRRGERIWAMLGAANRDPEQFEAPEDLRITRSPNRHVAFGYGIHFCLGAPLARLEGQIAIGALFERFPKLQLTGAKPARWHGVSLHRFESLPVHLS